jgi:FkbM family methyltransferase
MNDFLDPFLDYVNAHPKVLIVDLGAQIGQYSLFAAKMGRQVIAVEPFIDNLIRIHKSAVLENLQDRILLVSNAVSNQRNHLNLLAKNDENIGGQSLTNLTVNNDTKINKKYLVNTILLDDLLYVIPDRYINGSKEYKTILKIDIEGHEIFAFEYARNLFKKVDITMIYMEWGSLVKQEKKNRERILSMIQFFRSFDYFPYAHHIRLDFQSWINWPWDIVWMKN